MSKQGWISIHRKLQDNWLWNEKRVFSKAEAWIDLLLSVNHSDNKVILGNTLIDVKRGSFITSELKLVDKWRWSKSKVRAFLILLQSENMIVKKSDTKKTTITVVNYGSYQDLQTTKEQQKDIKRTSKEQQKDTNNNDNNLNNSNNDKKKIVYSQAVHDCFNYSLNHFPKELHPNKKEGWLDTLEKLNRIDGYSFEEIKTVIKKTREDPFWSKNFLSINKLRKKDSNELIYYKVFKNNLKQDSPVKKKNWWDEK